MVDKILYSILDSMAAMIDTMVDAMIGIMGRRWQI